MLGYKEPATIDDVRTVIAIHQNDDQNRWLADCNCQNFTVAITLTRDEAISQARFHQQSRHADQAVLYSIT